MPGPEEPPIPEAEQTPPPEGDEGLDKKESSGDFASEEEADAALDALEDEFEADLLEHISKAQRGEASPEERQVLKEKMKKKFVDGLQKQMEVDASKESEATEIVGEKEETTEGGEASPVAARENQKRMIENYDGHSDLFKEKYNELDKASDIDVFESALIDLRMNEDLITGHRFDGETGEELEPGWEVKLQLTQARDRGILSEEEYAADLQDIQDDIDRQLREGKVKDKIERTEQTEVNEVLSSEQLDGLVRKFDERVAKAWGDVLFERNNALQEIMLGTDSLGKFEHRINVFSDNEYIYEAVAESYSDDRSDEWQVTKIKIADLLNPSRENIKIITAVEGAYSTTTEAPTQRIKGDDARRIIRAYDSGMQDNSRTMEQTISFTSENFNQFWDQSQ